MRRKPNLEFVKLLFATFRYCIAQNSLNNVVAVYMDSLGYSAVTAGYLSAAYAVLAITFRLLAGFFADTVSRRIVLALGCLIFSINSMLFGFTPLLGLLLVFRAFQGGGYSTANTAASAICVDLAPRNSLNRYMSIFWSINAIATAVSGFITQYFVSSGRFEGVFFTAASVLFAAFIVSLTLRYEKDLPEDSMKKEEHKAKSLFNNIIEKKALPAFSVLLLLAASHAAITIYFLIYANSLGITEIADTYCLTTAGGMILGNIINPRFIKKTGYVIPLIFSSLLFGVSQLVLSSSGKLLSFLLVAASNGILMGMAFPILNTLAIIDLPYHRRGAGSGTVLLALDIGVGIGSFTWGSLIDNYGFQLMFTIAAILCFIAAILSVILFRKYLRQRDVSTPEEAGISD